MSERAVRDGTPENRTTVEYRAAHEGAVLADRSRLGRLVLRGKDAADLLHRLTTNEVRTLRDGEGVATIFTTPKGRILDLVTLHRLEDHLLCLTGEGRGPAVASWIDRYTFREDLRVEDRSDSLGTMSIYGSRAADLVGRLAGAETARLPLHHVVRVRVQGIEATLTRTWPLAGDGYHMTVDAGSLPGLMGSILESDRGAVRVSDACLDLLRIETGLPAAGLELTERYNPWEARLDDAISLTKGCYVGQEVIARLNTYNKVSKLLVRLRLAAGQAPPTGSPIEIADREVGVLTSVASVPGQERMVGLGYVRTEDAVGGREVIVHTPRERLAATIEVPTQ